MIQLFNIKKPVIAMIHVAALPGTPKNNQSISQIIKKAVHEASIYKNTGVDAIMIENMHDVPYLNSQTGPEIVAAMTAIAIAVKSNTNLPMGIQILAAANKQALAVAQSANLDFIRAEGFVFGHLADEGYINSQAAELLRYRKQVGAENIQIFTDIKKKHSAHAISQDIDILETAKAAAFFLSDGVIITGKSTGEKADINELKSLQNQINIPIIIGSGITSDNLDMYFPLADAFIVGSAFKINRSWQNTIDADYVTQFMNKITHLRHASHIQ